ncbi:uncharacterized protein FOMMEDRAFT_168904 [Fomitiporia mediterranea MF3/22]|uniref:uncharacterized protein n=1 Tax=Fomitiporia mediterranea (strain MF3/22) TaxID=694068 RepID=UPI0004409384|nr:uncharacterized protein FOMMEDRAFT_168904 [Fomitiporia mediterranea MF3/22]EJD02446.1 hypothetical protein FOMMEDRAFT_168904 [Fomitiporia mediterranea MF3/22]
MDQTQTAQEDFDIWEFVTCSKCQLPFSQDGVSGPSVPFWITECGHVLCNSHLNPDKSCPSCNAQNIELMALQKEMPPPFSDWFCSLPYKLDALAQAAKFQHERMASAARYYKTRYEQYRSTFSRLKNEIAQVKALKKENVALKSEITRLRGGSTDHQQQDMQRQQEPAPFVNVNGKRRILDNQVYTSSPRSIHTPAGPSRITLPPDHDLPPPLAQLGALGTSNSVDGSRQRSSNPLQPPGSSHFSQQYAYNAPQSQHMQMPSQQVLSYEQQAPTRQRVRQNDGQLMLPPPTPSQGRQANGLLQSRQTQRLATTRLAEQMHIGQYTHQIQQSQTSGPENAQSSGTGQQRSTGQDSRRFVPPTATNSFTTASRSSLHLVPQTPNGARHRFVPMTPSTSSGGRFVSAGLSGSRVAQNTAQGNGQTQRTSFIPR